MTQFHLPTRPYSPIDALNRRAAAIGSPRQASLTSYADYNGHHVTLIWNEYRRYYVAEYYWAGRVVLCRGKFATCLRATLEEYGRGALGASAVIHPATPEDLEICRKTPDLVEGDLPEFDKLSWYTWRHSAAAECARDMANPRLSVLIFDWPLMEAAESRSAYEAALKEKYGRIT